MYLSPFLKSPFLKLIPFFQNFLLHRDLFHVTLQFPAGCCISLGHVSKDPRSSADRSRPENRPIIRLLQAVDVCYARIFHRLEVRTPCPLPREGPAILVCNHTSGLDPMLVQSVCPRLITWMVAKEYVELPVLRWVFRTIRVIPVDRSGRDIAATRAAMRALKDGRVLGVFPEGRIETNHDLLPFQTGAAMMAIKMDVPVFPAYLDGTQRGEEILASFLSRSLATLTFGPAVTLVETETNDTALAAATDRIRQAVARLSDSAGANPLAR